MKIRLIGIFSILLLLCSCLDLSESDEAKLEEGLSELLLKLRAANLVEEVDPELLPQSCASFYLPIGGSKAGSCITPMSVSGNVVSLNLTGNYFGGGIRLLGGGSGFGQDFVIEGSAFNMENPEALGGEDNAQDTAFSELNNRIETRFNYLDIKFAIPRNDGNAFWTFKYVFVDSPFTDTATYTAGSVDGQFTATGETVADCIANEYPDAVQDAIDHNAGLLGGVTGAKAGDILVCRKVSSVLNCANNDFEWLNISSNEFSTTRPADADVYKFNSLANHKVTCEAQEQGYNLDLGGFDVVADLYSDVMFSAEIDRDSKIYEFQQSGVSSSYQSGSEMSMLIDFDVRKSLFIYSQGNDFSLATTPDYSELQNTSDGELAKAIWFKPVMVWQNSDCTPWAPGNCQTVNGSQVRSGIKANINVTLKGETEHPVFVCEDSAEDTANCLGHE